MTWDRIKAVGLELEGGWGEKVFSEPYIEEVSLPMPESYQQGKHHWGEIISAPLPPQEAISWLEEHYPTCVPSPQAEGTEQEKSAGFHIHLSFRNNRDYALLMSRKFYNQWLEDMEAWGEKVKADKLFFRRLEGRNRFARRAFKPREQVGLKTKDSGPNAARRTLLNYCHSLHGTIESRLFPMFPEKTKGVSALKATLDSFQNYLKSARETETEAVKRRLTVLDLKRVA